ncbi:MAG: UDP-N-acetylglucosamine 2-epimerase (non-hydrolyzing) [Flavobacteriales bacterium]|nr:UDP-N-acetylglucosamine 2-epimerase (non-hydrolyzing) [Flavobacteriales bacterium]
MKGTIKNMLVVVGTRPNFIKVTQFKKIVLNQHPDIQLKIVHTGQHYDHKMADVFFTQFELTPDYYLNIGQGSPIEQMASIMTKLEDLLLNTFRADLVIVPGDVNSTLAASLVANKMDIKLAHLESGLRSFDKSMPEEWNRILTDELSDYYFVTEESGLQHLKNEKKPGDIFLVGNTMIDTMVAFEEQIQNSSILTELDMEKDQFLLMTIHRPSNVDSKEGLLKLLDLLNYLEGKLKVVFPIHPRTTQRIKDFELAEQFDKLKSLVRTEPMNYFDFQKLVSTCRCVLTDSGGIQEETTFRQKACLTLRGNTERPSTVDVGTNTLVPFNVEVIRTYLDSILNGTYKTGKIPPLWDGKATERIMHYISSIGA